MFELHKMSYWRFPAVQFPYCFLFLTESSWCEKLKKIRLLLASRIQFLERTAQWFMKTCYDNACSRLLKWLRLEVQIVTLRTGYTGNVSCGPRSEVRAVDKLVELTRKSFKRSKIAPLQLNFDCNESYTQRLRWLGWELRCDVSFYVIKFLFFKFV